MLLHGRGYPWISVTGDRSSRNAHQNAMLLKYSGPLAFSFTQITDKWYGVVWNTLQTYKDNIYLLCLFFDQENISNANVSRILRETFNLQLLTRFCIGYATLTGMGKALYEVLTKCSSLQCIELNNVYLDDCDFKLLEMALAINSNIVDVDIQEPTPNYASLRIIGRILDNHARFDNLNILLKKIDWDTLKEFSLILDRHDRWLIGTCALENRVEWCARNMLHYAGIKTRLRPSIECIHHGNAQQPILYPTDKLMIMAVQMHDAQLILDKSEQLYESVTNLTMHMIPLEDTGLPMYMISKFKNLKKLRITGCIETYK
jgi:hypothetical protein